MPRSARRRPSAWGSVSQLPSGRWFASYRFNGIRFSAPTTYDTKAEGESWLATERADRHRGLWRDPTLGKVTLAD